MADSLLVTNLDNWMTHRADRNALIHRNPFEGTVPSTNDLPGGSQRVKVASKCFLCTAIHWSVVEKETRKK
jgi:hypothetical protein